VARQAWLVDYVDQHGARHNRHFAKKKEAEEYHSTARVEVRRGTHMPDSASITVAEAASLWLTMCETHGLERATIQLYRAHADLHIKPYLGRLRLSPA
jgi:hypothetical protein